MKSFGEILKRLPGFLLGLFTRRLWLKLLSLLLALILWTYIISTNTSLTRTKSFDNVSVETGTVSELTAKTLALATDIQNDYTGAIDVTVEVPQSRYSQLSAENITLTPDFSTVNSAGKYELPLNASSTYGTVTRLTPSTIQANVEDLVSREITAELEIINEDEDSYWYNTLNASLNPKVITVSGPSSLVSKVSRAVVQVNVEGRTSNLRRGYSTILLRDSNDEDISLNLFTLSTRASIVNLEIYPKKQLSVSVDKTLLPVPEGYEITSVSVQPETVIVAASADLLSELESLSVDVTDLQDASGSHSCKLIIPSDIRYYSASEITLTVQVKQKEASDE